LHLVGILFPHINDDARSKSHKKCKQVNSDTVFSLVTESLNGVRQEVQFHITGQNLAVRLRPLDKEQHNFAEK